MHDRSMTNQKLFLSALMLIFACTSLAQLKPATPAQAKQTPFACNLNAFNSEERMRWRKLLDQVVPAVLVARDLSDGYALQVNTSRVSVVEVAEWIELERKCCPFFDFRIDLHGEDGTLWLSLKGREGVKQFIQMDFKGLQDKLGKPSGTK